MKRLAQRQSHHLYPGLNRSYGYYLIFPKCSWLVGWLAQLGPITLIVKLKIKIGSLDDYLQIKDNWEPT